jgi:hypothetical protein
MLTVRCNPPTWLVVDSNTTRRSWAKVVVDVVFSKTREFGVWEALKPSLKSLAALIFSLKIYITSANTSLLVRKTNAPRILQSRINKSKAISLMHPRTIETCPQSHMHHVIQTSGRC